MTKAILILQFVSLGALLYLGVELYSTKILALDARYQAYEVASHFNDFGEVKCEENDRVFVKYIIT